MENRKSILIVFPHDPFELISGVQKRYHELLLYLHQEEFVIDLLALRHFMSSWEEGDIRITSRFVRTLFFYNFMKGFLSSLVKHPDTRRYLLDRFFRRGALRELPDFAFSGMKNLFRQLLLRNHYDFVLISYVHWAGLLEQELPYQPVRVLTIEDFIARNLTETSGGRAKMEQMAAEEVRRVNLFDRVICLSCDEQEYFSSRTTRPLYHYIPIFMPSKDPEPGAERHDLLFIGSDNPNNIKAMQWFFREVWPLLPSGTTMLVTGRISRHIPALPGVTTHLFTENLDKVYGSCRITVNPMQDGTGMKVKLIESLSYGIPALSTPQGLSGISRALVPLLPVAGDPGSFAEMIHRMLTDDDWYGQLREQARTIFHENFDISKMRHELTRVFA